MSGTANSSPVSSAKAIKVCRPWHRKKKKRAPLSLSLSSHPPDLLTPEPNTGRPFFFSWHHNMLSKRFGPRTEKHLFFFKSRFLWVEWEGRKATTTCYGWSFFFSLFLFPSSFSAWFWHQEREKKKLHLLPSLPPPPNTSCKNDAGLSLSPSPPLLKDKRDILLTATVEVG